MVQATEKKVLSSHAGPVPMNETPEHSKRFDSGNDHNSRFPVMKISPEGRVIYANRASFPVLKEWNCYANNHIPETVLRQLPELINLKADTSIEISFGVHKFYFSVVGFPVAGYTGMYGYKTELNSVLKADNIEINQPIIKQMYTMKKLMALMFLMIAGTTLFAQNRVFTKNGKIKFDATSPSSPEVVAAHNDKATSVIDLGTGAIQFAVLMKAFLFEKALMQEHFNENYVESDKYPKSDFKGTIVNMSEVNLQKDGTYPVTVKGNLTIKGITKEVESKGTLIVKGGSVVSGKSEFVVKLADYNIEVPSLVKDKLNKEAKISVDINYEPLKAS